MAISTDNEKLAVLALGQVFLPNLLLAPVTIDQGYQQQLLWGYPGILWGAAAAIDPPGANVSWVLGKREQVWIVGRR